MGLIDYGHVREGVFCHGTISDMDGAPKSTWTFDGGGRKVTRDQPIDQTTFDELWNTIAGSQAIQRHVVRNPEQQIDPVRFHVIGIAFQQDGQVRQYTFLVPVGERAPEFARWLTMLAVPQGSPPPRKPWWRFW